MQVRRLKRYKEAYRTFPHMTSPYVYPVGGFGARLVSATKTVIEANGGSGAQALGSGPPTASGCRPLASLSRISPEGRMDRDHT